MKDTWKRSPYFRWGVALFLVAVSVILFYKFINEFSGFMSVLAMIGDVLMPFIVGLVLAYLLSPIYDAVERGCLRLFRGKKETYGRGVRSASKVIATVASVLVLLAIVVGLISLVLPQAYASITNLAETLPEKQAALEKWIVDVGNNFGDGEKLMNGILEGIRSAGEYISRWAQDTLLGNMSNVLVTAMDYVAQAISSIMDILIGVIICVYVLNSKRLFAAQAKKVTYSLFKTSTANYMMNMVRFVDKTFGQYINGMLIDALMIGVLCFIGMTILQMPYALLVSTIVGVFNVLPIFGPIIAAVIGALFVLFDNPVQALIFLIFILILQQIDGNVIAPKILGSQTGLRGFWVVFAIIVGGGLFGFVGMILGVPMFAVVYALFQQKVVARLRKKSIPAETEAYDGLWEIDEHSGELKYEEQEVAVPPAAKRKSK